MLKIVSKQSACDKENKMLTDSDKINIRILCAQRRRDCLTPKTSRSSTNFFLIRVCVRDAYIGGDKLPRTVENGH